MRRLAAPLAYALLVCFWAVALLLAWFEAVHYAMNAAYAVALSDA